MIDYASAFIKICKKYLLNYEQSNPLLKKQKKGKTQPPKYYKQAKNIKVPPTEDENLRRIKKIHIIELLKDIVLKVASINISKDVKDSVVSTIKSLEEKTKKRHKGLLAVLELFGDPDEILKEDVPEIIEPEVIEVESELMVNEDSDVSYNIINTELGNDDREKN